MLLVGGAALPCKMELDLEGIKVFPGSRVNVKWKRDWYDGNIVAIGPKKRLCKIIDIDNGGESLVEESQLKSLQSEENIFAYNDGESWVKVLIIARDAVGAAKVSWRQNIHAAENETWFERENIAPIIRNEVYRKRSESVQASQSGLLPVKVLEPQSRTVKNIIYESDEESNHEDKKLTSPQDYPFHSHNITPVLPETPPLWAPFHVAPLNFVPQLNSVPPKNMSHASIPCVWSYGFRSNEGIAPHSTSSFFHERRAMQAAGHMTKYQSQSQNPTLGRREKKAKETRVRRHSSHSLLKKGLKLHGRREMKRKESKADEEKPPELMSTSPGFIMVDLNESIMLTCTAKSILPITYKWSKDGEKLPIHSKTISYPAPGMLNLYKVTASDEGIYSCTASNANGAITHHFSVIVQTGNSGASKGALTEEENVMEIDQVQNFLNAIVDEIEIINEENNALELKDEHLKSDQQENTSHHLVTVPPIVVTAEVSPSNTQSSSPKKVTPTTFFNNDMDQYLVGYGENYGESSTNIQENSGTGHRAVDRKDDLIESSHEDVNSTAVLTSLGSSHGDELDVISRDGGNTMNLPTEVESLSDQVQRLHDSIQAQEIVTDKGNKKWFHGIFNKKKKWQ